MKPTLSNTINQCELLSLPVVGFLSKDKLRLLKMVIRMDR